MKIKDTLLINIIDAVSMRSLVENNTSKKRHKASSTADILHNDWKIVAEDMHTAIKI